MRKAERQNVCCAGAQLGDVPYGKCFSKTVTVRLAWINRVQANTKLSISIFYRCQQSLIWRKTLNGLNGTVLRSNNKIKIMVYIRVFRFLTLSVNYRVIGEFDIVLYY